MAARLPPDVSRILYVKSLPFKITTEQLYDLFGKFGAIRQIRLGSTPETRGKAFVVYEDIFDAKNALEKLTGFNVMGRYIVVLYHQTTPTSSARGTTGSSSKAAPTMSAQASREAVEKKRAEVEKLKQTFGVKGMEE